MTIFARDADTGIAKWVCRMTPHDEWDFDGVNEMILTDQDIDGQMRRLLTHFDKGEIKWSLPEQFSVWSGALATAGDIAFYGTRKAT